MEEITAGTGGGIAQEDSFGEYMRQRRKEERKSRITKGVNTLAALGMTAGGGVAIAGNKEIGFPIMSASGGAALGYHGASALGASPEAALLAAALFGGSAAGITAMVAGSKRTGAPLNA